MDDWSSITNYNDPQQNSENTSWDSVVNFNTPSDIQSAESKIGSQDDNGYCQRFVEKVTGQPNMGASAIDAWNNYANNKQAYQGLDGASPGDPIYFSPNDSNGEYGHTGLYLGDDKFISATDNGVKEYNLKDWEKLTGQSVLGFVKIQPNSREN